MKLRIVSRSKKVSRSQLDTAVLAQFSEYDSRGAGIEGLAASLMFAEAVNRRLFGKRNEAGPYGDKLRETIQRLQAFKAQLDLDIEEEKRRSMRLVKLPGER